MKASIPFACVVYMFISVGTISADWGDDFDSYEPGPIGGQGGWEGWDGVQEWAEALVTTNQAHSVPHSLAVRGIDDVVQLFDDYEGGNWVVSAWHFVPPDFAGVSYLSLLDQYSADGDKTWATTLEFDADAGQVISFPEGPSLPMVLGSWTEIRIFLYLDQNWQETLYNGQLLSSKPWCEGATCPPVDEIQALNFFANNSSLVYYDDLSLLANTCVADVNHSGDVGFADVLLILAAWGNFGGAQDVDGSGVVDFQDLLRVLSAWGPCP